MPKAKKVIPKKKPNFIQSKLIIIIGIVIVITLGLVKYVQSLAVPSDINMIVSESGYRNPGPAKPSSTPSTCALVQSFAVTGDCGEGSYQSVTFTCGTGKRSIMQGGKTSCKTYNTWYAEAQSSCLSTCPSPTPTPTPKPTPKSSVMCGQEYGSCISKAKTCITYTDTCQKSANCATPFQACGNTIPSPSTKTQPAPATPSPSASSGSYTSPVPRTP